MIDLRDRLQHCRFRRAIAVLLVVLGLLVVWEHTGSHDGHAGEVLSMCMAVLGGAVAALGMGEGLRVRRLRLELLSGGPVAAIPRAAPLPCARAGPPALQVFLR